MFEVFVMDSLIILVENTPLVPHGMGRQVKLTYGWADSDFVWAVNAANVSFMLALVPINKLSLCPWCLGAWVPA